MHHDVLGDVGTCYSLPVLFHIFPGVKRRDNRAVMSKDRRQCTHCWFMWKRVDSPAEVRGRRKRQYTYNNYNTCITIYVLGDVGMRCSLAVMFHVFPVAKRRENSVFMSKDRRQCTHCWPMWKRVGLTG